MITHLTRKLRSGARAGFTLIELLAVILIISILMTFLLPKIPEAIDRAEVTACKANMQAIHQGMMIYKDKFNRAPRGSGVKFFAELIASRTWNDDKSSSKKLTCPAVQTDSLLGLQGVDAGEWYSDLDMVDGTYSSYAGRDTESHPLRKFLSGKRTVLMADDNDPEMNHSSTTNVLYSDGSVEGLELFDLEQSGVLLEGEDLLLVGADSPVEDLQVLSLD